MLEQKNLQLEQKITTMEDSHQHELETLKAKVSALEDQLSSSVLTSSESGVSVDQRRLESLAIRVETLR